MRKFGADFFGGGLPSSGKPECAKRFFEQIFGAQNCVPILAQIFGAQIFTQILGVQISLRRFGA